MQAKRHSPRRIRRSRQRGLTLLELMLALALTALVLFAISMAIDLHLRTMDSRRTNVEEAQLARAVLRLIANDLRGAVQYQEIDFSSVEGLVGSALPGGEGDPGIGGGAPGSPGGASGGTSSGGTSGGASGGSAGGNPGSGGVVESEEPVTSPSENVASSTAPPTKPGLYGNQYELQVDVSRLPRVDEYGTAFSNGNRAATDIPSDVKTVAYFVQAGNTSDDAPAGFAESTAEGLNAATGSSGLVRRQMDRAVARWASENGGLGIANNAVVVAPEVIAVEFRYYDGSQWQLEWDSDQNGGLPVAIEISVAVARPDDARQPILSPLSAKTGTADEEYSVYRLVIHLPMSEAAAPADEEAAVETEGEPL